MSSDTTRENASLADSSVTEYKNDARNPDDPGSPSCKADEDVCHRGAEERVHSCNQLGTLGAVRKGKLYNTKYFIIKSLNHQNIELSVKKGIWATQVMNEPILDEAFHNSGKVILIFSVNMSGFFQGYAQMTSSVGWRRDNVWCQGNGGSNPWGRSFKVKWLRLNDLPFQQTLHLKNPLNDYKPVKISRDCQELPEDIGEALCALIDGINDMSGGSLYVSNLPDEEYNLPSMHMAPTPYASMLYQHQAGGGGYPLAHPSPMAYHHGSSTIAPGASNIKKSKHSHTNGSISSVYLDQDTSHFDMWGLSAERSPLTSSLTEDDILDMTYEEYLEAHSGGNRRFYHSASAPAGSTPKSSSSKERSDDSQSGYNLKKRTRHHSLK